MNKLTSKAIHGFVVSRKAMLSGKTNILTASRTLINRSQWYLRNNIKVKVNTSSFLFQTYVNYTKQDKLFLQVCKHKQIFFDFWDEWSKHNTGV